MSRLAQEGTGGVDTTDTWVCAEYMYVDFGQQSAPVVDAEGCKLNAVVETRATFETTNDSFVFSLIIFR